ncbi:Cytochrome c oxidase assembly protein COX19 [Neolecta irregularis DAH-3]|uniref:Cytochrome c oxidase assembly protein COX19 n=1 Tax=Neolecta irregularis (strain DAH-3) TaxID=1198029 RepID=A0A1U7LMF0_NEOID|nr:Cytochrome c oxidase assembly protein COX19 [Neolecta irregularis DAH-3]|eukprot:OLL23808.1 Cytochrome c oxidase assembly protein COX19 [Neolecta irregularis DAH-3]
MAFGAPPSQKSSSPSPPARGSFPLDHGGECKDSMTDYIRCLKIHQGANPPCRHLAQLYLQCRMDKGLMVPDEMRNLGFTKAELEM